MNLHEEQMAPGALACPVCGSASVGGDAIPGWGRWRVCSSCTLTFADPLTREQDPVALFSDAYRGDVATNDMTDFHDRVQQRTVILDDLGSPELWFWTPAFDQVLDWVQRTVPAGGTVLDLGCGLGFFLHALRKRGFNAVGLDVADDPVRLNRQDGFEVWQGPVESLPDNWQQADAVVSFFMIHHLENPTAFFDTVRARYPQAPLAVAAYGPTNIGQAASLPPRTLIRWNSKGLGAALGRAGYTTELHDVRSTGIELAPVAKVRRLAAKTARYPRLYKVGKLVESRLVQLIPKGRTMDSFVVLALARPDGPSDL